MHHPIGAILPVAFRQAEGIPGGKVAGLIAELDGFLQALHEDRWDLQKNLDLRKVIRKDLLLISQRVLDFGHQPNKLRWQHVVYLQMFGSESPTAGLECVDSRVNIRMRLIHSS